MRIVTEKRIQSQNKLKSMHWSGRHKETKDWEDHVWAALNGKISKAAGRMNVKITSVRSHLLDTDNLVAGAKGLRDAIKRLGLIVDDSPKWADFAYEQQKNTRDQYTVIEIMETT